MEATCPDCQNKLRERAPNFAYNVSRRTIENKKDKYVCDTCETTYSSDEIHVEERGNEVI